MMPHHFKVVVILVSAAPATSIFMAAMVAAMVITGT
jgi:hypothetical protein